MQKCARRIQTSQEDQEGVEVGTMTHKFQHRMLSSTSFKAQVNELGCKVLRQTKNRFFDLVIHITSDQKSHNFFTICLLFT